ncbi:hypothetical protein DUNSADRAFT_3585 [Dunaliella salina]|uniref:Encoded protein n=1 Tax=Dunaliella salina TaxID=3046 RepID=A0ABQ7GTR2_DUNSA|nr:hypothetical protein DUNSADRAFT_3585 [Dunaliella salina]|eukprot:KAF5837992.1 hypothetical protein DUNSADRAFT_3585 [Dunaliella salina]
MQVMAAAGLLILAVGIPTTISLFTCTCHALHAPSYAGNGRRGSRATHPCCGCAHRASLGGHALTAALGKMGGELLEVPVQQAKKVHRNLQCHPTMPISYPISSLMHDLHPIHA